ncbi:MAG: flagellar protein FlbB [Micavibrio aeruginosavorus]|uniref:Flagellar protein FlbB n=1 Tax=Micavibrio aeruginosavorus TaxID=349221 RepID=A0A2W5N4M4_9BACT|nr:MAG: flagellar protein FlbB [Micavibrio aeruginosavorus]
MNSLSGFRILPILMVFAAVCFGLRFSQVMAKVYERATAAPAAMQESNLNNIETAAGETAPPPSSDALKDSSAPPDIEPPAATASGKPEIEAPSLGDPPAKSDWKGADDVDEEYSDVKMELFSDLSKRRKDLDSKEKELVMREALLKAGQAELEQKYKELTTIKSDIEELLKKQTEQEDQRIASLVKIYEGMKAKDAARIFNSLEMDVLLQVMTKMSERKSAPILAAMDPDKARNVTVMLSEQNKLPDLPTLPVAQ